MGDFKSGAVGFTFSSIGIILGWVLSQISQWARSRQEDKKNLKLVLFNLLETYYMFLKSDVDKLVHILADKVYAKLPPSDQQAISRENLQLLYDEIFKKQLYPELSKEFGKVLENYQQSIIDLAKIDPVKAYYLSGKKNISDCFDGIQEWFGELDRQMLANNGSLELGFKRTVGILRPEMLNETLHDLEQDIRDVSWKINLYVWMQSKKAIKRLNEKQHSSIDLDKYFKMLEPLMVA